MEDYTKQLPKKEVVEKNLSTNDEERKRNKKKGIICFLLWIGIQILQKISMVASVLILASYGEEFWLSKVLHFLCIKGSIVWSFLSTVLLISAIVLLFIDKKKIKQRIELEAEYSNSDDFE